MISKWGQPTRRIVGVILGLVAICTSLPAFAAEEVALTGLVDRAEQVVRSRLHEHQLGGRFSFSLEVGAGLDKELAQRFFGDQLRSRLRRMGFAAGTLLPVRLALVVSLRGNDVWAIGELRDYPRDIIVPIVIQAHATKALLAALGGRRQQSGGRRWEATRLAQLPGNLLDVCLVEPGENDATLRLATAHVDGVRVYRFDMDGSRLEPAGGPYLFREPLTWPRIRAAWLAARSSERIHLTTSGAQGFELNLQTGDFIGVGGQYAPVAQPDSLAGQNNAWARIQSGSSTLQGVLQHAPMDGSRVLLRAEPLRAAARIEDSQNWIWITRTGQLKRSLNNESFLLSHQRVGDQLAVIDLDGSGEPEIITTSPARGGESDQLVISNLGADGRRLRLQYRRAFEGSIRSMAVGWVGYRELPTLWFVEELPHGVTWLWKLEAQ